MKKLRDRSGQTLVESLVSILIIALTLAFLATALVSAAKIQQGLEEENGSFSYTGAQSCPGSVCYDLPGAETPSVEVEVVLRSDNGCWFYECADAAD